MMIRKDGERGHSLALIVLAVAGIWLGGGPVAFAQVEEPVPTDDPHPAEVEQQDTPRAELGKDEVPTTTVVVGEDEGGLIEAYTIEFGDEKDWAQLASGEWLRGNIERMRDGSMEFNSDEIKLITYDWKKVRELHSPRANTYNFTDDIQLLLEWRTNLVYTTIGNTNHVGSLDFTVRVTTLLHLNTSFLYLRTEDPFPRSDGTVPKKNDYQIVFGVSLRIG